MWCIAALLVLEFLISLGDALLKDKTRRLTALERGAHVILFINFRVYGTASTLVPGECLARPIAREPG